MTSYPGRVDHVIWSSRPERQAENVRALEAAYGVTFEGPWTSGDLGIRVYISWEAGLEVIAPISDASPFANRVLQSLKTRDEGLFAVVLGVRDIEAVQARLRQAGGEPGRIMEKNEDTPWAHKLIKMRELVVGEAMNTLLICGEIIYSDRLGQT